MVKIENIVSNSTADKAGLRADDKIIAINNETINDYIDYLYQISEPVIEFHILRKSGEKTRVQLERQLGEQLGIEFKEIIFDGLKQCNNNCIFCFVKQQPDKMRDSLNQKDDDYRFSFLQGSFVTLTNLDQNEIQRIIEKHLSPLNISVHTTNPKLRVKMMKNPRAAKIKKLLKILKKHGIQFHTQIVLCPGYNDKKELDKTLSDLIELYPELLSVGIVPVGLTKYRENLEDLRPLTSVEKADTLDQIKKWQQTAIQRFGNNFIYASDEFYLSTDYKLPAYDKYNDFSQLENGIGMTTLLNEKLKSLTKPKKLTKKKNIALMTSVLGGKALENLKIFLAEISNLKVDYKIVKNNFFGDTVTVTGLLTAQDLKQVIKKIDVNKYDEILIPKIVLNDENYFLDEIKRDEFLEELSQYRIKFVKDVEELMEVIKNG